MGQEIVIPILTILLGLIGFLCRSRFAKVVFFIAGGVCFAGSVAWLTYSSIDLSACKGSFIGMISCPPNVEQSREFGIARFSFGIWLIAMPVQIFLIFPLVLVAVASEVKRRVDLMGE